MDRPRVVIVGTVGHIDHSKSMLVAALLSATHDIVVCNEKPALPEISIKVLRGFDDPIFCSDIHRKSKGDKRRDRAERRSKGWR